MDTLIELIFNKLNRKCSRILLLENQCDYLLKIIKLIF